jgi:hypothetical protein
MKISNILTISLEVKFKIDFEGLSGLAEGLKTDLKRGLTPTDFEERDRHFGSNYTEPTKSTGKN